MHAIEHTLSNIYNKTHNSQTGRSEAEKALKPIISHDHVMAFVILELEIEMNAKCL